MDISIKTLGIDWDMVDGVIEAMDKLRADNAELRAEVERLRALLEPIQAERDELRSEVTTLEWQLSEATKAAERLRAFVQKVALYSNDAWLAREADELAPGAELKSC